MITLVGYMGSGKSSVAEIVSKKISTSLFELDREIEKIEKMSINDIFKNKGEIYFRKIEHKILNSILLKKEGVLSVGGGTPVFYNNMELIRENSVSFYLKASPNILSKRLKTEKLHRPLIAHLKDIDLPEFIAKHLFERNQYYQKANYTINTDSLNLVEVAQKIITCVKNI